tara:strand:- start:646 stop:993 length:348 start_codon:yes stop_codon:yes gene_type:complete
MSDDKPIIKDNRFIKVTGVYGKDNQLKNYKPSAPVELNIDRLLMPKLDYENGFNKGGAVMKKKKTKMMAKGGMAKKKTKMMAKGGKVKKTKMMAKGGKVKGTKMYSKGGKVSKGR